VLLKRSAELAERGHLDPGHWRALCAACLDTLRSAYRFAWTLPFTRAALAAAPHLMLGGDADVYPNFSGCAALTAEAGGLAAGTVLRLARRVYWEYQRQASAQATCGAGARRHVPASLLSRTLSRSLSLSLSLSLASYQLWDPNALAMCAADAAASDATSLVLDAHLVRGARETAVASAESAALELRSAKANAKVLEAAEQVAPLLTRPTVEALDSIWPTDIFFCRCMSENTRAFGSRLTVNISSPWGYARRCCRPAGTTFSKPSRRSKTPWHETRRRLSSRPPTAWQAGWSPQW
jgi:hypothetical protein